MQEFATEAGTRWMAQRSYWPYTVCHHKMTYTKSLVYLFTPKDRDDIVLVAAKNTPHGLFSPRNSQLFIEVAIRAEKAIIIAIEG